MTIGKLWSKQILGQWIRVLEIHLRFLGLRLGFQHVCHSLLLFVSTSFLCQAADFLWENFNWRWRLVYIPYVSLLAQSLEFISFSLLNIGIVR